MCSIYHPRSTVSTYSPESTGQYNYSDKEVTLKSAALRQTYPYLTRQSSPATFFIAIPTAGVKFTLFSMDNIRHKY